MSGIGAFCGFLFIFIFILISPLILIRSKKAENGEVKDHPRDFHFEENSPKGIHPFPGKSNTLSFVVSTILVDLLGLVICLIFFFFLIRCMKYSFNLKKVTIEKAYKHWEKNTNNYTPLSTMNPRA